MILGRLRSLGGFGRPSCFLISPKTSKGSNCRLAARLLGWGEMLTLPLGAREVFREELLRLLFVTTDILRSDLERGPPVVGTWRRDDFLRAGLRGRLGG